MGAGAVGGMSGSSYSAIYSFGDSLSDAGEIYLLSTSVLATAFGLTPGPASPPYYSESYTAALGGGIVVADLYSNGPVWVQDLATALGLAAPAPGQAGISASTLQTILEDEGQSTDAAAATVAGLEALYPPTGADAYMLVTPALNNGTDFAISGSVTGVTDFNTSPLDALTNLSAQLANFQAEYPTPAANALYTVWSGSNDLLHLLGSADLAQLEASGALATDIAQSVQNEITMVQDLVAGGAQTVLVADVPDLAKLPGVVAGGATETANAGLLATTFNTDLVAALATTDFGTAAVKLVDVYGLIENAAIGLDGLTNVTQSVYPVDGPVVSTDPAVQDQYLFFDGLHPTATGHEAIADLAAAALVSCFAAGTRIATPGGPVPVEALAPGDRVTTLTGPAAIGWVGRRTVRLAGAAGRRARPVRIQAGAFGAGLPARDLLLSPEHAVYAAEVLIPARALCGCRGIAVDQGIEAITYYHVALAAHGVLFAEGLPCESWLDTGGRALFENVPAGAPAPRSACAPRVESGPALDRVRAGLGGAATQDVALDRAGLHVVAIAPGTGAVRLSSLVGRAPGDGRRLGAAVTALALDGRAVALDDWRLATGFHAPEDGWIWTDGAALLTVGPARALRISVAALAPLAA